MAGIKKPNWPLLKKQGLGSCLALFVVVLTGTVFTFLAAWASFYNGREHAMLEYEKKINIIEASLYREISLHVQALRSLSYLFSKGSPDFGTFTDIALQLITEHPDMYGLGWIPFVPAEQRQGLEEQMQEQFPDFQFTEFDSAGRFVKAAKRTEYYPIYYLTPMFLNSQTLGFDLGSKKEYLEFLKKSRDSGLALVSEPLNFLESREPQTMMLAVLPTYKRKPLTVEGRREQLEGFVTAIFRMEEIVLRSLGDKSDHGKIMLVDADSPAPQNVLYSSSGVKQDEKQYTYTIRMPKIWGRNWVLSAEMPRSDYNARTYLPAFGVLVGGIFLTIFLAKYIQTILQHSALVSGLVTEKTRELEERNESLQRLSTTDGMTGIANQRYMDEYLNQSWARAVRDQIPITFAICDIDYFKLYNDTYGHLKGDECLKDVANGLKRHLKRPSDLLARYGGGKFAIILFHTADPNSFLQKCLKSIEQLRIPHKSSMIYNVVTVSMGCFTTVPDRSGRSAALIKAADAALGRAKQGGRNRLEVSENSVLSPNSLASSGQS